MKVFVTGVAGQLGHDVVNELTKRGHQAVGSDIAPALESCASYVPLDITIRQQWNRQSCKYSRMPSCTVRHRCGCSRGRRKSGKSQSHQRRWNETYCGSGKKTERQIVYSTDYVFDGQGDRRRGSRTAKIMHRSMYTDRANWGASWQWQPDTGKVFYRSYRLGIWIKRQKILLRPC